MPAKKAIQSHSKQRGPRLSSPRLSSTRLASTGMASSDLRISIDTGGTFTDCVFHDGASLRMLKVRSTPADPSLAIVTAIREAVHLVTGPHPRMDIRHGTTVGTNTLLERKGARTAFVTTLGFEDSIVIGRQARARIYDWFQPAPQSLCPDGLRFGIAERIGPQGQVIEPITEKNLLALVEQLRAARPESIALSLLFSFANPAHERRVATALQTLDVPVSISYEILPEFREYERASTVAINAYLAPKMGRYLTGLRQSVAAEFPGAGLHVMQSSGGIVGAELSSSSPARSTRPRRPRP